MKLEEYMHSSGILVRLAARLGIASACQIQPTTDVRLCSEIRIRALAGPTPLSTNREADKCYLRIMQSDQEDRTPSYRRLRAVKQSVSKYMVN
mmetsp:Transcript_13546/g.20616  ORF Transcript_13546/g.20616 Transcript_13546/m.20616 type:complete len:93 (+) Transcript_13546:203-481(+)